LRLRLFAEICDINRFSSDKKLVGWAGLAPSVHQSGDKTVYGRVGRGGNREPPKGVVATKAYEKIRQHNARKTVL